MLTADAADPARRSTAAGVRTAFERLRTLARQDDLLLVVLVGHGSADAESARFNLVGPDLNVAEWAALVDWLPGRVVFVNAAGASFPFLGSLARRNRIVVTATDAAAQRYDTTFPEQFVKALADSGHRRRPQRPRVALGGVHAGERRGAGVRRLEGPARHRARAAR